MPRNLKYLFILYHPSFRIRGGWVSPFLPLVNLEKHLRYVIVISVEENEEGVDGRRLEEQAFFGESVVPEKTAS